MLLTKLFDWLWKEEEVKPTRYYDFRKMGWGHALHDMTLVNEKQNLYSFLGHSPWWLEAGDVLTAKYQKAGLVDIQLKTVEFMRDPSDMFKATGVVTSVTKEEIDARKYGPQRDPNALPLFV